MCTQVQHIIIFSILVQVTYGLYIKPIDDDKRDMKDLRKSNDNEWSVFQQKLGLSNQKVDLLKSQKDQEGTKELLKRFIKENPKYVTATAVAQPPNSYKHFYNAILKELRKSNNVLRTSLNFELADKSTKNVKRPRRKINVKMTSDMSTDKIDELLQLFNQQYGIESDSDNPEEEDITYNDLSEFPVVNDNYAFGNLYEDEEDSTPPRKLSHNSEFGSFQNLFLQAKRSQYQREIEETKLLNQKNNHFL